MKKSLTILLSIFMITTVFTVDLFADSLTIASVLATVDGGFSSSDDLANIPANAWANQHNEKIFINTSSNNLVVSNCGVSYPLASELTLESENKYKFSNGMAGVVHFTLNNNKLIKIEIDSTFYANAVGEFAPPKTIKQILTDSFPTTDLSGWGCTSSNTVLYQILPSMDSLYINQMNDTDPYIILQNQITTKVSDNQYKYHNSEVGKEFDIFFNLESGSLQSIVISGATGDLAGINGTYTAPLLVSDIIPSDFPVNETNAWTNGTYNIYLVGEIIKLNGSAPVVSLDTAVRPIGDGNYHFTDHMGTITFIMNDDKFVSIVASGFTNPYEGANGTYAPSKTIADILNTYANFPTTETSGWVKENGSNTNRIYKNDTDLMIGTSTIPLNSIVTKDGENYKYQVSGPEYTFNMESGILKNINVFILMAPPAVNGIYVPYKYEIEPTGSKPQGYTGTLVFKTNAQYSDPSKVIVKVNGVQLALTSDYTVEQGSTIVTLLGNYLKNLVPNTYTISIGVQDTYDEINSQFTITGSSPSNNTSVHVIPNTSVE